MNTAEPRSLLSASGDAHARGVGGTRPFAAYQTGVTLRTETSRDICFGTAKHTTVQRPRGCVPRATCYHGNGGRKVCSLVELCATLSLVYTWTVFALLRVLATSAVAASRPLRQASTRTGKHASHLCTFNGLVSPTVGVVFNTSMNPLWLGSQPPPGALGPHEHPSALR